MKNAIFKLLIACLVLSTDIVFGQSPNVDGYRNDLFILKASFEMNHPSLYRFNSKDAIDKLFNNCSRGINSNTTDRKFYKSIKFILSNIEDGHLSCSPSDSLKKEFDKNESIFLYHCILQAIRLMFIVLILIIFHQALK